MYAEENPVHFHFLHDIRFRFMKIRHIVSDYGFIGLKNVVELSMS